MDETTTVVAVAVAVIVYVVGLLLLLLVAGSGIVRLWRGSRRHGLAQSPVSAHTNDLATRVVEDLAARAGIATPACDVVPLLGAPPGQGKVMGTGGLALTRTRTATPTVLLAGAAVTKISSAALTSLVAHELGHVVHHATPHVRRRQRVWVLAYALVVVPGIVVVTTALILAPQLAGLAVAALAATAMAFLAVHGAAQRRDELQADRFAIALTGDLAGAVELMALYDQARRRRLLGRIDGWFATHPSPPARLEAMRAHLTD